MASSQMLNPMERAAQERRQRSLGQDGNHRARFSDRRFDIVRSWTGFLNSAEAAGRVD
jgi:hypothetical protein